MANINLSSLKLKLDKAFRDGNQTEINDIVNGLQMSVAEINNKIDMLTNSKTEIINMLIQINNMQSHNNIEKPNTKFVIITTKKQLQFTNKKIIETFTQKEYMYKINLESINCEKIINNQYQFTLNIDGRQHIVIRFTDVPDENTQKGIIICIKK